jgi:hypothetical protein
VRGPSYPAQSLDIISRGRPRAPLPEAGHCGTSQLGFRPMPKATFDSSTYDPATLKILWAAFDAARADIRSDYQAPAVIEDRRRRLALLILGIADRGERDVARIQELALRLMHRLDQPIPLDRSRTTTRQP